MSRHRIERLLVFINKHIGFLHSFLFNSLTTLIYQTLFHMKNNFICSIKPRRYLFILCVWFFSLLSIFIHTCRLHHFHCFLLTLCIQTGDLGARQAPSVVHQEILSFSAIGRGRRYERPWMQKPLQAVLLFNQHALWIMS